MIVIQEGQRPVEVRTGFQSFQVSLLVALLLWGGTMLAALATVQGATAASFPQWAVYLFFGAMTGGTLTTFVGLALERFRASLLGVLVERAGLTALIGLTLSYSVWVLSVVEAKGLPFAYLMFAVWGGGILRCLEIRTDLKSVKQ